MRLPRPVLRILAILFAAATVLYSAMWMYYVRWEPRAAVGIEYEAEGEPATARVTTGGLLAGPLRITRVVAGSGAEKAGIRPGDRVRSVDDRPPEGVVALGEVLRDARPGDVVRLTIERPGEAAPRVVPVTLGPPAARPVALAHRIAIELVESFPIPFVIVGLVVLFGRLEDRHAWLLALLFAGFIAIGPILEREGVIFPPLRGFAVAFKTVFDLLVGALFYYFFAVFPAPSWLDRRLPWLKNALLAASAAVAVPLGLAAFLMGGSRPLFQIANWLGPFATTTGLRVYYFGSFGLALLSLASNRLSAPDPEARRKTGVILWGTVAAVTPYLLLTIAASAAGKGPYEFPFWVWAPCVLAVLLLPASFAYAVVKHRVLEVPVLLRRSARYVLVKRGVVVLVGLIAVADTALFTAGFTRFIRADASVGIAAGVAFGLLLAGVLAPALKKTTHRIDRAFFRSAYDARLILENLARKIRTASSREALGALLKSEIGQALHPRSISVHLAGRDGRLRAGNEDGGSGPEPFLLDARVVTELESRGEPLDVPPTGNSGGTPPQAQGPAEPECLVPILGRDGRLAGLVALGPRRSEESYSRDDKQLLISVAGQAGIALDSLRMAEEIADRMEAERRVAIELEVARDVQSRLLPQTLPRIRTLECAGVCNPARMVGGDLYDFLDLGDGEIGLVLADIAGKGMAGALLMASLQANLRSQASLARHDLPRLLRTVNRALFDSSAAGRFATLFFGCYSDETRRLRYANCGHDPPILLRADGSFERLGATATVLGAFENWDSTTAEVSLAPGDTLLLYSDGIREAMNDAREEFGEAGLLQVLRCNGRLDAPGLLAVILAAVEQFSRGLQEDDVTLLVARCR